MKAMRVRIGLREVRALEPGQMIWDSTLPGFGARRQKSMPSPMCSSIARGKAGSAGTLSAGTARPGPRTRRATRPSGCLERARTADPAAEKKAERHAKTVAELCDLYIADVEAGRLLTDAKRQKNQHTGDRSRPDRTPHQAAAWPPHGRRSDARGCR